MINGIPVYFPFKPYECQNNFMAKVIEALNNSDNALLESPTGTGKTLSLLCSALSWLKQERSKLVGQLNDELPKIIYTSRTHS
jgi:regulator of telomere elongation helicase 1